MTLKTRQQEAEEIRELIKVLNEKVDFLEKEGFEIQYHFFEKSGKVLKVDISKLIKL